MSEFSDDIDRGCLENGEPLEAKYGCGYWSKMPEKEPDLWDGEPCPNCGNVLLHTYDGNFVEDCPECGWKIF